MPPHFDQLSTYRGIFPTQLDRIDLLDFRLGGIMIETGQVLYDNDPRYRGRKIEFIRI